jgi:hypothetical protein
MSYYYLASQLPGLGYGQAAPMSSSAFKDLAGSLMKAGDAAWLGQCVLDPGALDAGEKGLPDFFIRWNEWERALRLNLARWRAARLKRDIFLDTPDYPTDAVAAAKAASALDSPLEAELLLDEARWAAIDSFQGFDHFNRNTIYAYLLKLLLLERRSCFRADEGFAEYKRLYAAIMEPAAVSGVET